MSCETQLDYFNASLSRRDLWSMRSESCAKIDRNFIKKINENNLTLLSYRIADFQCSICMQSYRQAFSMGAFVNSGFSANALIFNTHPHQSMRQALLTDNIALSITLLRQLVCLLRAIGSNGVTCESFEITPELDNF